jgi:signal transduction histidine kinase
MWNSLRVRIFMMAFVVVAIAVGLVSLLAGRGVVSAVTDFAVFNAQRDERIAAALLQPPAQTGDIVFVQDRAEALGQAMGVQIMVFNPQGVVLADSAEQRVGQVIPLPAYPITGAVSASLVVENQPAYIFFSHAPPMTGVVASGGEPFTVPVAGPPDMIVSAPALNTLESINRSLLFAATAGGGVALLLTLVFSQRIVGPVEALTAAARQLEKGDLSQRVPVRSGDEIGTLAHAFNSMADGLARTEQLRRQMVSDIAHELRTPLTNLRGYLEAVRDGVVELKPEVVRSLYEESMLLNRLVDDLQELSLAEAGQLKLQLQAVAVSDVVANTLAALPPTLTVSGPVIRLDLPADLPPIRADAERIRQALRNLLTNALHHTPPDGSITISAQPVESEIEIRVRDTGEGIAPEHLPNLFERFYRADVSRSRATGGAGLGLAIVKQLVEAHGGAVRVESVVGEGTTFTIALPTDLSTD